MEFKMISPAPASSICLAKDTGSILVFFDPLFTKNLILAPHVFHHIEETTMLWLPIYFCPLADKLRIIKSAGIQDHLFTPMRDQFLDLLQFGDTPSITQWHKSFAGDLLYLC